MCQNMQLIYLECLQCEYEFNRKEIISIQIKQFRLRKKTFVFHIFNNTHSKENNSRIPKSDPDFYYIYTQKEN